MNIVIAPDSFKESLSAFAVAQHIEAGFRDIFPQANYIKLPLADGGEGTVEAMVAATAGQNVRCSVCDPLGQQCQAFYGITGDGDCAIIEMAAASGLERVPVAQRNPLITTTFGTGELIVDALNRGIRRFIIGLGGSATNDGGAGMLQALGVKLLDKQGRQIGFGGGALAELARIDLSAMDPRLKNSQIDVACDVTNPLTGEQGAAAVFGPQKGATAAMVAELDANLRHYALLIQRDLGVEVNAVPGSGAAGGMGAALLAFFNATLRPGIDIVAEAVGLEAAICQADLVITGEGRIDSQTLNGKVPFGVARIAKKHHKPVIALAGSLSRDVEVVYSQGLDAVFSVLTQPGTRDSALADAADNVYLTARNVAQVCRIGLMIR